MFLERLNTGSLSSHYPQRRLQLSGVQGYRQTHSQIWLCWFNTVEPSSFTSRRTGACPTSSPLLTPSLAPATGVCRCLCSCTMEKAPECQQPASLCATAHCPFHILLAGFSCDCSLTWSTGIKINWANGNNWTGRSCKPSQAYSSAQSPPLCRVPAGWAVGRSRGDNEQLQKVTASLCMGLCRTPTPAASNTL